MCEPLSNLTRAAEGVYSQANQWYSDNVSPCLAKLQSGIDAVGRKYVDLTNKLCGNHLRVAAFVRLMLKMSLLVSLSAILAVSITPFVLPLLPISRTVLALGVYALCAVPLTVRAGISFTGELITIDRKECLSRGGVTVHTSRDPSNDHPFELVVMERNGMAIPTEEWRHYPFPEGWWEERRTT